VLNPGFASSFDDNEACRRLSAGEVLVEIDLGAGEATGRAWTCDLTAEYVQINAEYRT
jgi:glutamate N-acetyltransferase/amino-acid N-acetyltransferase